MSLAFLSKKSWHTGTIKNNEAVWIAEQNKAAEQKKIAELQKQLAEEREIEELRRMRMESGEVVKKRKERLDWMYEVPKTEADKDEFLLGKAVAPSTEENDLAKASEAVGGNFMNKSVDSMRDNEAKIRDDPMLAIKRKQQERLKELFNNPVKMKELKMLKEMKEKKEKKKSKKEKKKAKKAKKKARKERAAQGLPVESDSSGSSDSDREKSAKQVNVKQEDDTGPPMVASIDDDGDTWGLSMPKGYSGVAVKKEEEKEAKKDEPREDMRRDRDRDRGGHVQ
eukprot:GFYU01010208.1.p2 GENE.GFYU01010208.1~~GFYU01010208.1.p2  ORF type:complete len:282 (+),score=101.16 GFYU01010208.1:104-949(+)